MTWYNSWLKPVALAEVLAWLWRRCCFSMPSADQYADRWQLTASSPPQEYLALPSPPLLLPFFLPPWCAPILTLHAFLLDLSDLYGVSFPVFFCMLLREDRWWENPKSRGNGYGLMVPGTCWSYQVLQAASLSQSWVFNGNFGPNCTFSNRIH